MSIALIVHGGAKSWPQEKQAAAKQGCANALRAGWEILETGGSALDAVEAAIRVLESDSTFNAGYGSVLNADGKARMDAGIMDGSRRQSGAVGAIEGVRHPISVARLLLEQPPVLVVGPYARQFAEQNGAELCDPDALITREQREEWEKEQQQASEKPLENNTVGAVALDLSGSLACGVSTGGTGNNMPGRVGDSASVGAGFYADSRTGACAMTGDGEAIMRSALAARVIDRCKTEPSVEIAAQTTIQMLAEYAEGEAGCILLDHAGNVGWAHNSAQMACGYRTDGMDAPCAFIQKSEETGASV